MIKPRLDVLWDTDGCTVLGSLLLKGLDNAGVDTGMDGMVLGEGASGWWMSDRMIGVWTIDMTHNNLLAETRVADGGVAD